MTSLHSLRGRLVDSPDSLAAQFRRRRWEGLTAAFPDIADMTVIDLGGRAETWRLAPVRPRRVHVVNLETPERTSPSWVTQEYGNACELPDVVTARSYDLVFSNAVLEHVGGHLRRVAFAASVGSLATRHWIQTPYRYFPVEPHWLFPWFQHLPISARTSIAQNWSLMHTPPATREDALRSVMEVELVSRTEMQFYFPDSQIVSERVGPLVKSLIAVKS